MGWGWWWVEPNCTRALPHADWLSDLKRPYAFWETEKKNWRPISGSCVCLCVFPAEPLPPTNPSPPPTPPPCSLPHPPACPAWQSGSACVPPPDERTPEQLVVSACRGFANERRRGGGRAGWVQRSSTITEGETQHNKILCSTWPQCSKAQQPCCRIWKTLSLSFFLSLRPSLLLSHLFTPPPHPSQPHAEPDREWCSNLQWLQGWHIPTRVWIIYLKMHKSKKKEGKKKRAVSWDLTAAWRCCLTPTPKPPSPPSQPHRRRKKNTRLPRVTAIAAAAAAAASQR